MRKRQAGPLSSEVSLPAPVGGWNARDALAAMPVTDAVTLTNLFPKPDRIDSRGGSTIWSTGMTGNVDTLMEWAGPSSRKMLAWANGSLYDVSLTGAVGAAITSGKSTTAWQSTMITTPGGAFLVMANGSDPVQNYDGTALTVPTITGVTAANLASVNLYRYRLFFIEKNTLHAWYLDINSIAGAASQLDLGALFKKGGSLVAMGSWTTDGGDGGSDDYAVFVTSEGEIALFNGPDPSTAGAFNLVGIFQCGKPLGKRPLRKYGADLLVILEDGVYPISSLLKQGVIDPALALSDKIRGAFVDAARLFGSVFGWQMEYYPTLQRLIVNVPASSGATTYAQYVMNAISRSWCPYAGLNARTWCSFNSLPYFGDTAGRVWAAESGGTDNNVAITVNARQAYSDLGAPGRIKHVVMARPRLQISSVQSNIVLDADVDYQQNSVNTLPPSANILAYWNVGLWNKSYWSLGQRTISDWQTLGAVGTTIAPRFVAALNGPTTWYGTDLVAQAGAIL